MAATALLAACSGSDAKEDLVQQVNRDGAVESSIKVEHLDSARDIIITTHKVWNRGQNLTSAIHRDTIPSLGYGIVEGADAISGDARTGFAQKDYEVYITLK